LRCLPLRPKATSTETKTGIQAARSYQVTTRMPQKEIW
jgi:hypothetical protein